MTETHTEADPDPKPDNDDPEPEAAPPPAPDRAADRWEAEVEATRKEAARKKNRPRVGG